MTLWFVTFELDDTCFLVDAETKTEAIQDAIIAMQDEKLLGELDEDEFTLKEIESRENYYAQEIDISFLCEKFWGSCLGLSKLIPNVIVFAY